MPSCRFQENQQRWAAELTEEVKELQRLVAELTPPKKTARKKKEE